MLENSNGSGGGQIHPALIRGCKLSSKVVHCQPILPWISGSKQANPLDLGNVADHTSLWSVGWSVQDLKRGTAFDLMEIWYLLKEGVTFFEMQDIDNYRGVGQQ